MIVGPELLLISAVAAVGVLHTVVPDHWVPITLIARQQGWTKREVARAAFVAGTGHTVSTLIIGFAVWIAGVAFATRFGNLVSSVSSLALIAFGGWIAISSLRELQSGAGHGHGHEHGNGSSSGIHGPELTRIAADHDLLELSIFETGQPAHFRLSGHRGDRVWVETRRAGGSEQRFEFRNCGAYWESRDEVPEPHEFSLTVFVAQGARVHSYEAAFSEHEHEHNLEPGANVRASDNALYVASPKGTNVLATHVHMHRHGHSNVHTHLHDHGPDSWHDESFVVSSDPPLHDHKHRRSLRTTLLLILGSSPMVEGIPAFFAAGKYGIGLIAVMAIVFALSTIATYITLCVTSVAGLQRISFGPLESYGEVLSGAFIAAIGAVFLVFPVL